MNRKTLVLIAIVFEGGLFILGLMLSNYANLNVWKNFRFSLIETLYALLLCIPMFAILYVAMRSPWEPFIRLRNELEDKIQPIFADCKPIDFAIIALFAGTGEELLFRGWLQNILSLNLGIWPGILLASLIFGIAHYISRDYAVYAFITGIYLGIIYWIADNLYIVMAIHALYDFAALVYLTTKAGQEKMREI